jgi:formylglycine-generating enzyme required for sulfatase activity
MSRIFLSHSSADAGEAIALREWLAAEGWDDIFLDLDPARGLKAGERWQGALKGAAERCELVIPLISPAWAASKWCLAEFLLATSLNKRILGVVVAPTPLADLPTELTAEWQIADLTGGARDYRATITLPPGDNTATIAFASRGLDYLRVSLQQAGLDARYFAWPPESDPRRSPYRGLRPLEAEDAGIFFGREAPVVKAIEHLRGLRAAPAPRMLVILGASGAGKSSFLRAGLLPRLRREDRAFMTIPIVRPQQATLFGETGFLRALEDACAGAGIAMSRAELRAALRGGAVALTPILHALVEKSSGMRLAETDQAKRPTLVLSIDQAEELFLAEGAEEAKSFLALLREVLLPEVLPANPQTADTTVAHAPAVLAVFTIRSDKYEPLQVASQLEGLRQDTFSLPPMPKGSYAEVIKGPARRLEGTARALAVEDVLVDALLDDVEEGGAKDALPLLAFTLERLYDEYHAGRQLKLEQYETLGRVKGSIEAAVERAFKTADADGTIPRDRQVRLALLRKGMIPWLAGIDPDTGAPRRRVARLSEIPPASRPLIDHLVEQRLLSTDVAATGETTIEPAHEALLRQWSLLQGWLTEDAGLLSVLDAVKRAAKAWNEGGKTAVWLIHAKARLEAAERLADRPDLAALLEPADRAYLAACREVERLAQEKERAVLRNKQRMRAVVAILLLGIIAGLVVWINQGYLTEQWNWYALMRPYMLAQVRPHVLSDAAERALQPMSSFRECAKDCPEMVVVPPGTFIMGSPETEKARGSDEGPLHKVTIADRFAVAKFPVTFDEWDTCAAVGGCPQLSESGWGRGRQPAINLNWDDAQQYVAWLSRMTGKTYRLLSETEWEYAARAGTATVYYWGDEVGSGNANCIHCGSPWDGKQPSPVGSFKPNPFGLYDISGNVWTWLEDCYHDDYIGAPTDAAARSAGCEQGRRAVRGGAWDSYDYNTRIANRDRMSFGTRINDFGLRVARTLLPGAP